MIKEFYLYFQAKDQQFDKVIHISCNIEKHLKKLKYITYRRIDIALKCSEVDDVQFEYDDGRHARIVASLSYEICTNLCSRSSIAAIYNIAFGILSNIWLKYGWDIEDLVEMLREIEQENYFVQ